MFATRLEKFFDAALTLVYPQACVVCGQGVESHKDGVVCEECWQRTRIFSGAEIVCWKCGALAEGDVDKEKRETVFCRRCGEESFDAARAVGVYEGALRAEILRLKVEDNISQRLSYLFFEAQKRKPLCSTTRIVPVPLHKERLKERGFNQAAVLARSLSKLSKLPVDENSFVRAIHTEKHRSGMDAKARRDSVEGAFRVVHPRLIKDEKILLVDDVFTTGATTSICAKALKEAGACKVYVLTVARPMF